MRELLVKYFFMSGEMMPMQEALNDREKESEGDRFSELSNNYGELFTEVFQVQGLNYQKFQSSAVEAVKKNFPDFKNLSPRGRYR